MNYMFETEHLKVRKFKIEDAQCLYENHLEEKVKKWIPNESYADIEETQGAICIKINCALCFFNISIAFVRDPFLNFFL